MVSTPGSGSVFKNENMQDGRHKHHRLKFTAPVSCYSVNAEPPIYELLRHPVLSLKTNKHELRWTWQYSGSSYSNLEDQLSNSVARVRSNIDGYLNDKQLVNMLISLRRTPGFHLARRQAHTLHNHAERRWSKVQSDDWPYGSFIRKSVGRFQREKLYTPEFFRRQMNKNSKKVFRNVRRTIESA